MADAIRVGIVGATVTVGGSGFGAQAHVPALHAAEGVELTAVCTTREETAQASAEEFGARLSFTDVAEMAAHPDIDLVVVCVRVPWHHDPVMTALAADKPVLCEWPLGVDLTEAQRMAEQAREGSLATVVGLQGRSDPVLRHARDLVADGYVGEVLTAHLDATVPAVIERGAGRSWQADRANGANTLTIAGGHSLDALAFVVGEPTEVDGRLATRIGTWRDKDSGEDITVTSPDTVGMLARTADHVELVARVAAVPTRPTGTRLVVHGREGSLAVTGAAAQIGPHTLHGIRGDGDPEELTPPPGTSLTAGVDLPVRARNVAEAYARLAAAWAAGEAAGPDFDHAVRRHALLAAIERSAAEGHAVAPGTLTG